MQWQCLHCNQNNDESNKFCTICGNIRESARPGKFCTSCGVKLEWSSAFCSNCGTKAASPGVTSQSLTPQNWQLSLMFQEDLAAWFLGLVASCFPS